MYCCQWETWQSFYSHSTGCSPRCWNMSKYGMRNLTILHTLQFYVMEKIENSIKQWEANETGCYQYCNLCTNSHINTVIVHQQICWRVDGLILTDVLLFIFQSMRPAETSQNYGIKNTTTSNINMICLQ